MKEIIRANHSGFCFGVREAIEKAEKAAVRRQGPIYSCGSLIHNSRVTDSLARKGIQVIESPREAEPGATVIIRSHGEGKAFYEIAEERQLRLVDATCPFVARIHDLVRTAREKGQTVVIVGDENHPEVRGINGWCGNSAIIVDSASSAYKIEEDDLFVVAQTTIQRGLFDEVLEALRQKGKRLSINNTICSATSNRQKSCMETAKIVELMLVLGDRKSSNTKKLYDISKKYCNNVYFIENIEDLPLKEVEKCNRIGIAAGASTPECLIKEVIANMSEITLENNEINSMDALMDEIEKSLRLPRGGEIVTGKVHQVTDKEIIVNLGCKKDGIIPLDEITVEGDQKLTDLYQEGDEIQAKVVKTDDGDGSILLSKKKLEVGEHWDEINQALEDKSNIEVKVVRPVNGGVIAAYKEVSGFIPLSQLSDRYVENAEEFVGQVLTVKVSRVDQRRGKAVFSHKMYLNEEKNKRIAEIWEGLSVDDVVEGTVMRFTDYGAFVDIGGIDGLLHISEISWGKLKHPQEVLSIGDKIRVKVLSMSAEKGKISLGLKQNQPEPWSVINDKYEVGQIVKGKVVQIKEYGAFVELEPGLDGLVHISEVAHKRVGNIADELSVGQEVSAKILEIDQDRRRISLSIKETLDESDQPLQAEEPAVEEAPTEEPEADEE
ncbi:bifunctional 4-hydroxy-3-methylbut-2-enyl diphosphate reductase/30S ribosomal protein S1 [bacterium 210820-DFI.6.37]|nr:bifunctional 4-hydroxy-3-methylbut-2-enyl diphosphate reductase/30S ribosomal protein S1 [bacterium 210820-DFI.6.37]